MDFICVSALNDWRTLNGLIGGLNEDQVSDMIEFEVENRKRPTVVVRLHQRLTALRSERERAELLKRLVE